CAVLVHLILNARIAFRLYLKINSQSSSNIPMAWKCQMRSLVISSVYPCKTHSKFGARLQNTEPRFADVSSQLFKSQLNQNPSCQMSLDERSFSATSPPMT